MTLNLTLQRRVYCAVLLYKPRFNVDSGNCRFLGCMLSHKLDYDPSATAAARCAVEGCTDARYPNYRANAVYDDGSCKVRASVSVRVRVRLG